MNNLKSHCKEQQENYLFGLMDEQEESSFLYHLKSCLQCGSALQKHRLQSSQFEQPKGTNVSVEEIEHKAILNFIFELEDNAQIKQETSQSLSLSLIQKKQPRQQIEATEFTNSTGLFTWIDDLLFGSTQGSYKFSLGLTVTAICLLMVPMTTQFREYSLSNNIQSNQREQASKSKSRLIPKASITFQVPQIATIPEPQINFRPLKISANNSKKKMIRILPQLGEIQFEQVEDTTSFLVVPTSYQEISKKQSTQEKASKDNLLRSKSSIQTLTLESKLDRLQSVKIQVGVQVNKMAKQLY